MRFILEFLRQTWGRITDFLKRKVFRKPLFTKTPEPTPPVGGKPDDKQSTIRVSPIAIPPKIQRSIVDQFPPVITDAIPEIWEVQKGGLRLIFGELGVPYVPQLAFDITESVRQDAVSCFFEFLLRIRVNPDLLLLERSPIEAQKFEDSVGLLLEVDEIRREFDLSAEPVYQALSASITRAEFLLTKMQKVRDILRNLGKAETLFYEYRMWVRQVQHELYHWERYADEEIDSVLKFNESYQHYQHQYNHLLKSIDRVVSELNTFSSTPWKEYEVDCIERIQEVEDVKYRMMEEPVDRVEPMTVDDALSILTAILEELEAIHEKYRKFEGRSRFSDRQEDDCSERRLSKARLALALDLSATFDDVKRAYRKLAIRLHPDQNQSDPEAGDRFRVVKDAYDLLNRCLGRGPHHG